MAKNIKNIVRAKSMKNKILFKRLRFLILCSTSFTISSVVFNSFFIKMFLKLRLAFTKEANIKIHKKTIKTRLYVMLLSPNYKLLIQIAGQ